MSKGFRSPCVFNAHCGSRAFLRLISKSWTALVIYDLAQHPVRRTGQMQKDIGGISQKMLTLTLRRLEADGLVKRKVYPVIPPMVEYSLTPLGRTLISPLRAICQWSEKHGHLLHKQTRKKE